MKLYRRLELWREDFSLRGLWEKLENILDAEQVRWFLFVPVIFGLGIYTYFSLSFEPSFYFLFLFLLVAGVAAALIAWWGKQHADTYSWFLCLCALAAFVLGFATSFVRVHNLEAPQIVAPFEDGMTARVISIEATRGKKTQTWLVAPLSWGESKNRQAKPKFIRLSLKPFEGREDFRASDEIFVQGVFFPPPERVLPDGFDHRRNFWFKQIGGSAKASTPPRKTKENKATFGEYLDNKRNEIARRINEILTNPSAAGIAAALIVGKRGFISEAVHEKLRGLGLAHILAISGLHMVAFAGLVYFLIRLLLALIPALALRYPIKKWAMVPALAAALFYLFLSGASLSTQRAFIMFVIGGIAVLRGVNVLTLRNVAFAALAILVLFPESLFQASFQLSFAATLGIVATYETLQLRWFRRSARSHRLALLRRRLLIGGGTLLLTSTVAWAATAPFGWFHFNRIGFIPALVANFFALPLFTFAVMPLVVLALPLLLWDRGEAVLHFLGEGLKAILSLAEIIIQHIGVARIMAAPPDFLLPLFIGGGLWLCLWRTSWRWLGAAPLALFFILSLSLERPRPVALFHEDFFAVRGDDGKLYPSAPRAWIFNQWLRADGDSRNVWEAYHQGKALFACQKDFCETTSGEGLKIIFSREAIVCPKADIFVGEKCKGEKLTISLDALRKGTHAVYLDERGLRVETKPPDRGRFWEEEISPPVNEVFISFP